MFTLKPSTHSALHSFPKIKVKGKWVRVENWRSGYRLKFVLPVSHPLGMSASQCLSHTLFPASPHQTVRSVFPNTENCRDIIPVLLTIVFDHGKLNLHLWPGGVCMETIAISKFKATCLSLMERVKKTGKPLLVTKRGEPVCLVEPPPPPPKRKNAFGCMKGTILIKGDIVSPLPEDDWEALSS
jgi:antitoxin (DNA-binding transcriptional repressor) of toxin-antitoxin stability system